MFQTSRNVVRFVRQAWHFVTSQFDPICLTTCHKSFCVTSAILLILRRFQKMTCILRASRSTLETSIVMLLGSCILQKTCRVAHFFAKHIVRPGSSGGKVKIAWEAWEVRVSFAWQAQHLVTIRHVWNVHSAWQAQHLAHSTLYTVHSALYTPHFTLYASHTLHFALDA